ncbi:hypothetical protein OIO90_000598 [Microbotryomycetes sp. JL221]|nr:hypothetical protein OIO90_000598 [Microbotryomycetes sp. JL221]
MKRPPDSAARSPKKQKQQQLTFGQKPIQVDPDNDELSIESDDDVNDVAARQRRQQERADAEFAKRLAKQEGITMLDISKDEQRRERQRQQQCPQQHSSTKFQSDEANNVAKQDDGDDSDDMIIIEDSQKPPPKDKGKQQAPVARAPPPLASIFSSPTRATSGSTSKVGVDIKPDVSRSLAVTSPPRNGQQLPAPNPPPLASIPSPQQASKKSTFVKEKPLDTSLYEFNPLTDVDTSSWPQGRVPYSFLTNAFVLISSTKSRLFISRVLTNLLRTTIELDPQSLEAITYLTTNRLGPAHEKDLELGIGSQVLGKAIKEVSGLTPAALRTLYNKYGDPGDVAFEAKRDVRLLIKPAPLVCHSVFKTLLDITRMKGQKSVERKAATVHRLLVAAQGEEVRFITRTLCANLRIGAVRLTLTAALAKAFCLSRFGLSESTEPGDMFWISRDERDRVVKELAQQKAKTKVKEVEERHVEAKMEVAELLVRKVWARHPHYGHLIKALASMSFAVNVHAAHALIEHFLSQLDKAFEDLETRVPLAVGTPIEPMLGQITRALSEIYTRLDSRPFVAEAKLDGQRGQIHVSTTAPADGQQGSWYDPLPGTNGQRIWVKVFSRHLLEMTDKYPDIAYTLSALVQRQSEAEQPLTDFIIDCEIVAVDPQTGAFKTFQELSYRSRKDVEMGDIKVRVGIYAFDLMFLNGESLLGEPFRRRRDILRQVFAPMQLSDVRLAKWELIPSCDDNDPEKVKEFFDEVLKMRAEGIMVKLLDEAQVEVNSEEDEEGEETKDVALSTDEDVKPNSTSTSSPTKGKRKTRRKILPATYEPDKRADSWLKVKKDYLEDLGDSLDLIPIGGWHGQGRKAAWWSPILLGCYDQETGQIQAVCKCMSGFTDSFYLNVKTRYHEDGPNTTRVKPSEIDGGNLRPSVWFQPSEVWEIRGADFTLSPVYPAAAQFLGERGVSVRFPRFIKIREDKSIEQATSSEQLAGLYDKQGDNGGGVDAGQE